MFFFIRNSAKLFLLGRRKKWSELQLARCVLAFLANLDRFIWYAWTISYCPFSLVQFRAAIRLQFDFHRAIYNLGTVLVSHVLTNPFTKLFTCRVQIELIDHCEFFSVLIQYGLAEDTLRTGGSGNGKDIPPGELYSQSAIYIAAAHSLKPSYSVSLWSTTQLFARIKRVYYCHWFNSFGLDWSFSWSRFTAALWGSFVPWYLFMTHHFTHSIWFSFGINLKVKCKIYVGSYLYRILRLDIWRHHPWETHSLLTVIGNARSLNSITRGFFRYSLNLIESSVNEKLNHEITQKDGKCFLRGISKPLY